MQRKDIFCGCGVKLAAKGKATAKECRACHRARRSAQRKTEQEYRRTQYLRRKAKVGRTCVDCGKNVSAEATRCYTCQNRRPDANAVRAESIRVTRYAKNVPGVVSENAGRQRAQRMYPQQPCSRCGNPKGIRHHKDRDTFNNDPSNIEWLCQPCHVRDHIADGHVGFKIVRPPREYACGHCGATVMRYESAVPNGTAFCSRDHYTAWRRGMKR